MERFTSCETCHHIWRRLSEAGSEEPISLGSAEEALSAKCPVHKSLVEAFIGFLSGDGASLVGLSDMGIGARPEAGPGECVYFTESISKGGRNWPLLLVQKTSVPGHPGTGRILSPDWADLDMIRRWKRECVLFHGTRCENPLKIWHTRPTWLIDAAQKCLVPGNVLGPFVALSYMYGRHKAFTIDDKMLVKLQSPGSLDSLEVSGLLAPIIRHAIVLTVTIGERYLWADAICITNDDTTIEQLRQMGAIYANAVVTIIATDGDSRDGLPGIRGVSDSRGRNHQRIFPFGDEQVIVRSPWTLDSGHERPYHTRGWTYQEERMSPRKIIFHNQTIHWECQCSVFHEDMVFGAQTDEWIESFLNAIVAGFPDLNALDGLIFRYNKRRLRYDEDALPAIAGVLAVVSRSFAGGFLYGLPEMFFDRVLGWRSLPRHGSLRRRTASTEVRESKFSESGLPSWSWVGWDGLLSVDFYREEAMRFYHDRNPLSISETFPITEWFTSDSPHTPPERRRRIRSTWFDNRDTYKDISRPLPPGWTRHEAPNTTEPRLYPDGCGKHVFSHAFGTSWFFPFPVTQIDETTPPFVPAQTRYLFCETTRARLWSHQVGAEGEFAIATLENDVGGLVGELHLHSWEDLALFPADTCVRPQSGLPVEVVAISRARVQNRGLASHGQSMVSYYTYTVLWIEWEDGVAYRRASGEVNGEEWESLDLEPVSLVLG